MTTQTDYADLIRRLEAATGPDRELDAAIDAVIARSFASDPMFPETPYTSSLDAALTLVPAHHLWWVKQGFRFQAVVWMIETDYDERYPPTGFSTNSPAIAFCIAAIKARAAVAKGAI